MDTLVVFFLTVFDVGMNIVTFGGWGRAQGDKKVADRWME